MHRKQILDLISEYQDRFPGELDTINRITDFVQNNENCFDRELVCGHVTGSAWVLNAQRTHVLLTHHKKLNIWVQLGGHADGDSDIANVAMKEALEESGLKELMFADPGIFDIDIHQIPARGLEAAHDHFDCRFLIQATDSDYIVSDESHDLKWIPLGELHKLSSEESMLRMVEKSA
ncbi:MAG: 8-oxo-dGTP pyrophosphatase MutT (NUDIX family) [Candidatus Azotimanducaceae bacterium]|jgi:8-oxo-dGTP pyrophosphatase MutT (NUDIX family)